MDFGGRRPNRGKGHKWIGMKHAVHHAHLLKFVLMVSI